MRFKCIQMYSNTVDVKFISQKRIKHFGHANTFAFLVHFPLLLSHCPHYILLGIFISTHSNGQVQWNLSLLLLEILLQYHYYVHLCNLRVPNSLWRYSAARLNQHLPSFPLLYRSLCAFFLYFSFSIDEKMDGECMANGSKVLTLLCKYLLYCKRHRSGYGEKCNFQAKFSQAIITTAPPSSPSSSSGTIKTGTARSICAKNV